MGRLKDFLYPGYCLLCGNKRDLVNNVYLCSSCYADFTVNHTSCSRCAIPMNRANSGCSKDSAQVSVCGQCLASPPEYDMSWSPFIYTQPLEWVIQQFKFNANLAIAPLLSELMIQKIPASIYKEQKPDALIPMPLHDKRLKHRGFNQSLLLAQPVAKALGVEIDTLSCQRLHNTEHQTGKNARQREQNIRGAFKFENHRNYQYLVIFDDVVTTGSTVSELSKIIKKTGVARVDVWSLARAEKVNK